MVASTLMVTKCFEWLVIALIKDIDVTVDPHQYTYRKNHSTDDAMSSVVPACFTNLKSLCLLFLSSI